MLIHDGYPYLQVVGVRAVILSPTRELALQTLKVVKDLGKLTNLRACLLVGGEALESQYESLAQNPDILIATPGAPYSCVN